MMRSGHCIDHLCHKCTWPRCDHECHHTHAAEMVAQTFDRGAMNAPDSAVISGRIRSGAEGSYHLDADLLNELAESRIHE